MLSTAVNLELDRILMDDVLTVTEIFLVKWDAPNISYWLAFVLVLKEMEVQDVVQLSAVETYSLAHVLAKAQT